MIYFMQPVDGGPIKIGYSEDVERRHKELERHYKKSLVVLATMPGDADEERRIHEQFDHLRLTDYRRTGRRLEQFHPSVEIMDFIGCPILVDQNQDLIEPMDTPNVLREGYRTVYIDKRIYMKAKMIAQHKGISVTDLISGILKRPIDQDYLEVMKKLVDSNPSE